MTDMTNDTIKIADRLAKLREEFARGQQMLADLDREREEVRESLLRISGAIQVLEELDETAEGSGDAAADT